jgi:hypothetical protein
VLIFPKTWVGLNVGRFFRKLNCPEQINAFLVMFFSAKKGETKTFRRRLWFCTGLPDCIFKQKIPIGVNFGGSRNGRCWYILWPFGLFTVIWYILWQFGRFYGYLVDFFPVLVCFTKKNLATLVLYSVRLECVSTQFFHKGMKEGEKGLPGCCYSWYRGVILSIR